MFKKFKAMAAYFVLVLGLKELPIEGSAISISAEQKQKLQDALGEKVKLEDVVSAMNQELADMQAANDEGEDQELKDLRAEAMKMLIAQGLSQEDADAIVVNPASASTATEKQLLEGLILSQKEMDKKIQKLVAEAEPDSPLSKGNMNNSILHSASHFLGSGKQYDAFEGRNWNKRAAGTSTTPTDFAAEDKVEIQKLKNDIDLYYRENPTEIKSQFRDLLGLPAFWNIRTKVDHQVADGNIVTGEISQARKAGWLPKNKQLIQPEQSQVFPVHIDMEWSGYELQTIEASWLNSWNKEGSQPYKWSFVRFLLSELDKKARQEDRMVAINGVFVKTPDNATIAGTAINRGDGLLIQLWRAYFYDKKFKVANIGLPTDANIVDYVPMFLDRNLPEESKNASGFVLYCSPTWLRKHKIRYRQLYGMENDYSKDGVMDIENYPNVRFQTLRDLEGSDLFILTFDDNIELMENIPGEKSMYNFDTLKRVIYGYADYKWGARFKHIGMKVKDTDPDIFKVQTVWTNIPPYLHDTFVPLYDDTTGEIALPYSNISIKADWETDITDITNTYVGQVVKIRGNTSAEGLVVDTGNITLAGNADFDLSTGGTLTLLVNADSTLTEIKRTTTAPTAPDTEVSFTGTSIDANDGYVFNFTGGSNVVLASILNGVDGQTITINGSAGANTVTVSDVTGLINVGASRVLAVALDYVTFVRVDGVWEEIDFNIEA